MGAEVSKPAANASCSIAGARSPLARREIRMAIAWSADSPRAKSHSNQVRKNIWLAFDASFESLMLTVAKNGRNQLKNQPVIPSFRPFC